MIKPRLKGKRIVFIGPREVSFEEFEVPKPINNKVLIRTSVTCISTGTELTILNGKYPVKSYWSRYGKYPSIPGYSNVGKILEVGKGIKNFRVGDRVFSSLPHTQFGLAREDDLSKIPPKISDEAASLSNLATIAMNSVRLAQISLGESVTVVGVGIVGQLAIMFCKLCGAFPIIAVDLSQKRLKLAKLSGATYLIQANQNNTEKLVRSLTKNRMSDVVFEVTGNPDIIPQAIRLVKNQGRFIILSSPRGKSLLDFHDEVNFTSRVILGTHFNSHPAVETPYNPWTAKKNRELFLDLIYAGIIDVNHLISHHYPWFKAKKAYEMLIQDGTQSMGVVLDFRRFGAQKSR